MCVRLVEVPFRTGDAHPHLDDLGGAPIVPAELYDFSIGMSRRRAYVHHTCVAAHGEAE